MKKLSIKLLGVVVISAALSSAITPAFALGGCGPNHHRNGWGQCVWGSKSGLVLENNRNVRRTSFSLLGPSYERCFGKPC